MYIVREARHDSSSVWTFVLALSSTVDVTATPSRKSRHTVAKVLRPGGVRRPGCSSREPLSSDIELVFDDLLGFIDGGFIAVLHLEVGGLLAVYLVLGDEAENVLLGALVFLPRFCQSSSCPGQLVLSLLLWVVADDLEGRNLPPDPEQEAGSPVLGGS